MSDATFLFATHNTWSVNRKNIQGIIRHGENSGHLRSASAAHRAVLSVWQAVHESGIFVGSTTAGGMKRKVWACTLTSAIVGWIFGIWQPMHSLPAEPGA